MSLFYRKDDDETIGQRGPMTRGNVRCQVLAALAACAWMLAIPSVPAQPAGIGGVAAEEKQACIKNLKTIYAAIQAYEADNKDLPNWLSDLVPDYLPDPGVLICPVCRRTGKAEESELADPKIPCTYLFEFCPINVDYGNANGPKHTRREWKRRQMGLVGSVVPVVRCRHHGEVLNLAFDGTIYESPAFWEYLFTNRVSAEDLTPARMFADGAGTRSAVHRHFPSRDANAGPAQLDLTKFYNTTLTEAWLGKTNVNLSTLPRGNQVFGGVDFDVRGILQVRSRALNDKRFPTQVSGIPVHLKCRSLHFLHAVDSGTPADAGTQVGAYFVHFRGNQARLEIPVVYDRDVRNWHGSPDEPPAPPELKVVWKGENGDADAAARLFETTWTNLAPDMEIESIDFVSSMAGPAPFLIAISADLP
jgi:hypothetical protein